MADAVPCVTSFRGHLGQVLAEERAGRGRDVIVLAIDGIPLVLARRLWPQAVITPMCSVVPTTSISSWLSSLTGLPVSRHGLPGMVIRLPRAGIVNVLEYRGPLGLPAAGNIFSDAARQGYAPMAVQGDFEPYDCSWRDALLAGARCVSGPLFYKGARTSPEALAKRLTRAVEPLRSPAGERPRLIWCFIDADQAVHRDGYSDEVCAFLEAVESIAWRWALDGAVVMAHSDHGLTPTRHHPELQRLIDSIITRFGCFLGGAGRMRWVYAPAERVADVMHALESELPSSVSVIPSDRLFEPGSLARERVGDILLVPTGRDFITFDGDTYEHGSMLEEELLVPLARWGS